MRVENMGKAAYENTSSVIPASQYINMHRKISTGRKHIKMSNGIERYIFYLTFFCNVHIF